MRLALELSPSPTMPSLFLEMLCLLSYLPLERLLPKEVSVALATLLLVKVLITFPARRICWRG